MTMLERMCVLMIAFCAMLACSDHATAPSPSTPPPSTPAATVSSVSITGAAPPIGTTQQFSATATLSNGATQSVTGQAVWSSSNPAVATVSNSGLVTGVGPGDTDIAATYQTVTGRLRISVAGFPPPPQTFMLTGLITDVSTHAGIAGGRVEVLTGVNAGKTASTDGSGTYVLGDLGPDSFRLRASAPGHEAGEQ